MTESNDPAPNHRLLITFNRIVAVLSIAAAILLYTGEKSLGLPGIAAAPYHEPLIVHCLLTAIFLLGGAALLNRRHLHNLTKSPIWMAGWFVFLIPALLNLIHSVRSAMSSGFDMPLAYLFGISSVLLGWPVFAALIVNTPVDCDPIHKEVERSRVRPMTTLWRYIGFGLAFPGAFVAIICIGAASETYFRMLDRVFLEKHFEGWCLLVSALLDEGRAAFSELVGIVVIAFGLFVSAGLVLALRKWADLLARRNLNRDLKGDEIAFIRKSIDRLAQYARHIREKQYGVHFAVMSAVLLFAMIFGLGWLLATPETGIGAGFFDSARTKGLAWYLYLDGDGIGAGLSIFSALIGFMSLWLLAGLFRGEAGLDQILDFRRKRSEELSRHYYRAIALDVRRAVLSPNREFDPAAYLRKDLKRAAANFCFPAAVLFAINLAFLYLDRMDYDLLTEDYIETTDYWTSKVHRVGYGDVDRVEVTCAFEKDGDLELSYRLELGDNRSIKAISLDTPKAFRTVLPDRLAAWTKVDARLRAAGVQVVHEVRKVKGKRRSRLNDEDCAAGLDNLIGREVREKVMPLLREAGARSPTP